MSGYRAGAPWLALIISCAFASQVVAQNGGGSGPPVSGIIVKYRDDSGGLTKAQSVGSEISRKIGVGMRYKRQMGGDAHVLSLDAPTTAADARIIAQRLAQDPRVLYAEPDYQLNISFVPNDTYWANHWSYSEATAGIRLPQAWDKATGTGVVVAVLDTGYRPHDDLSANILPGYDFVTSVFRANDGAGRDNDATDPGDWSNAGECGPQSPQLPSSWHGTHVAGTIAAVTNNSVGVAGVAFNARILPVRVLGKCGGDMSDVADGIRWAAGVAVSQMQPNQNPAHVINMSLGAEVPCTQTLTDAVAAARARNVTVIAATGNRPTGGVPTADMPANCPGVIAVTALDRAGARAAYANYGVLTDIAAPGGSAPLNPNGILSTFNAGTQLPDMATNTYAYMAGTSMATPHVSGVAALIQSMALAKGRTLTPDQVESILRGTARAFPVACADCGSGLLDASAAVNRTEKMLNLGWLPAVLEILMD